MLHLCKKALFWYKNIVERRRYVTALMCVDAVIAARVIYIFTRWKYPTSGMFALEE